MQLNVMPELAHDHGVTDKSSSDDIKKIMGGPLGALAPFFGIDLTSVNSLIDNNFNHDAKEAFAFMNYAAKTELGTRDLDDLIKSGDATKLAKLWNSDPNHSAFRTQYAAAGTSNMAFSSNVSPSPNPVAGNASSPVPSVPGANQGTPSLAANQDQYNPAAIFGSADLMKMISQFASGVAQMDPKQVQSLMTAVVDIVRSFGFLSAGLGNNRNYAELKAGGNGGDKGIVTVTSVSPGKFPAGPPMA